MPSPVVSLECKASDECCAASKNLATEAPKNGSGRDGKRDQLSFHCRALISRSNLAVKVAYESLIIPLSKKVSWPQVL